MTTTTLLAQLRLDALLVTRHRFLHVMLGMAVLFGVLVRFALPEDIVHRTRLHVLDPSGAAASVPGVVVVEDRAALEAALLADDEAVGLVLGGETAELVLRGSEAPEVAALAKTEAEMLWLATRGQLPRRSHDVTMLSEPRPPAPFSTSFVPVLLAIDVILLGFFFSSVLMLQERTWGTVRYFRAGPGSTTLYLGSKLVVMLGLTALGTLALVGIAAPRALLSPLLWGMVLLGSAGLTLFGTGLAAWFKSLKTFFLPLVLASLVGALPLSAYFLPTLSLGALSWLPTWAVMVGAREALFPSGASDVVVSSSVALLAFFLLSAAFAYLSVDRRIMRGG